MLGNKAMRRMIRLFETVAEEFAELRIEWKIMEA
jgi:hypothetical protein